MPKGHRSTEHHARRVRSKKLFRLRMKYVDAKSQEEKQKIFEKVQKIAPWLSTEAFLKSAHKQ